jgi:uncharacterized membrane protein
MDKSPSLFIEPKKAGIILIATSVVIFILALLLTQTIMSLKMELHKTCPLPPEACPYKSSVPEESVGIFALAIGAAIVGIFLVFSGRNPDEPRKIDKNILGSLTPEEKRICDIVTEAGGSIFQIDIIQKTGFSKVKVSRILDRLELKGIIERRRRGMTNLVLLK